MKIMFTANAAWNIWNFRRCIAQALLSGGHEIVVLAPHDDSAADLKKMGCKILQLEMSPKGLNPLDGLRLKRAFKDVFLLERPNIVLSYTIKNNIFGAMAARSVGVPFIPNVTGLGTAFLSGGFLQTVAETLYRRAFFTLPLVFFQNEDDRALFLERRLLKEHQICLLPGSGIDLNHFKPEPYLPATGDPVFLMISRILKDKGVLEFVEAARKVKARVPKARFQLLGSVDAQNRSAIDAATLKDWVDEGVIEYLRTTKDVRPYIANATCIVLPSYREGAPRTLIEAAAMGRPTITTDVPGCRSVVEADVTGLLCAPQDSDSLAQTCMKFLSLSREARAAMGLAGRRRMEDQYDQSIIVERYWKAISQLVSQNDQRKTA